LLGRRLADCSKMGNRPVIENNPPTPTALSIEGST
jgi:hypothetical protein